MKLLTALEIALKLYQKDESHLASPDVKEIIRRKCAFTEPDLYDHLFSNSVRTELPNILNECVMKKVRIGVMNKLQKEINRERERNITGRRGEALLEAIIVLGNNIIAVDEDDKIIVEKLQPFVSHLMKTNEFPPKPPDDPDVVLSALNDLDEDAFNLIMAGIFFLKGVRENESQLTHIPEDLKTLKTRFAQNLVMLKRAFDESNLVGEHWAEELSRLCAPLKRYADEMKEQYRQGATDKV